MARSFSANDYKGNRVQGTVVWEDRARAFLLVHEDHPQTGPVLWLIDNLDDVGVALDAEHISALLPRLKEWAKSNGSHAGSR